VASQPCSEQPTKEREMDYTTFSSWKSGRQMVRFSIEQDEFMIEGQAQGLTIGQIFLQMHELGTNLTCSQIQRRLQFLRSFATNHHIDALDELLAIAANWSRVDAVVVNADRWQP
jgi:hypothetical protein